MIHVALLGGQAALAPPESSEAPHLGSTPGKPVWWLRSAPKVEAGGLRRIPVQPSKTLSKKRTYQEVKLQSWGRTTRKTVFSVIRPWLLQDSSSGWLYIKLV